MGHSSLRNDSPVRLEPFAQVNQELKSCIARFSRIKNLFQFIGLETTPTTVSQFPGIRDPMFSGY